MRSKFFRNVTRLFDSVRHVFDRPRRPRPARPAGTSRRGGFRPFLEELESRDLFSAVPLGSEFLINTTVAGIQQTETANRQSVAANPTTGDYVVVWESQGQDNADGSFGIYGQRYTAAGAKIGSEFLVNTTTANDQMNPAVAEDANGNFVVSWMSFNQAKPNLWSVYAQRFDSSGAKVGTEFLVNTTTDASEQYPVIAMANAGSFVIAWAGKGPGDTSGVNFQRFDASGTKLGGETRANTTTTNTQTDPSIAMNTATGDFVIAWQSFNGTSWNVFLQQFSAAGATQGGETQVNDPSSGQNPSVGRSGNSYVVAFQHNSGGGSGFGIFTDRFTATATGPSAQGSEFVANTFTTGDQTMPSVGMDAAGNFVITWTSAGEDSLGDPTGVYAQNFAAGGTTVGAQYHVSTSTAGAQQNSSIAVGPTGSYLIVWSGNGTQTGNVDSAGVFGQLYASGTGFTVTPTSGLVTTESGGTATFTVVLNTLPIGTVTIDLSSSNTSEGKVSPVSLTFTTLNWNVPQTVTLTGQDDLLLDGDQSYTVTAAVDTDPLKTLDPLYRAVASQTVSATNRDNDVAVAVASSAPGGSTYGGNVTFTATVSPFTGLPTPTGTVQFVVDGSNFGAAVALSGGGTASLSTTSLGAGTHTVVANYIPSGGSRYVTSTGTLAGGQLVNKADAAITVSPYGVTYDGSAHTATGTATGVFGENLGGLLNLGGTTHTNAGTYNTDAWSFAGNANYNAASGTVADTINKANATIGVGGYNVTYDATAHTASGTAKGVLGEDLSSLLNLAGTSHTNAGTYTDGWSFAGNTNYNSASGIVTDKIAKANAAIAVSGYAVTFDGAAHTAAGTATGIGGVALAGLDLSGTAHTNAGSYAADAWTFTDVTGNYNNASGTVSDSIAKANAVISVTGYTLTYDGAAHTATGSATGVGGAVLAGLNLSGTTHTNAGTYSDSWTFTDVTGNYNNASGTVSDRIGKANATIAVAPYAVTYDGTVHTATGTATGVGGAALSGLNLSGTAHTNAGSFTDTWTFTDVTGNYNNASGSVADSIAKADATIAVTPYGVTYDGNPHTATGTATGVGGVALSGLDLSGTTETNAGTYNATWTFTDATGNYNNASGAVVDTIAQANIDARISVTGYAVTFDGNSHTATGTATGVNGEPLSSLLDFSNTTHMGAASYTDRWTFAGDVNYAPTSGTVLDTIAQAGSTVTVTWTDGAGVTYDGNQHGASASWASSGTDGLGGGLVVSYVGINGTVYNSTAAPTDAGQYRATASFAGDPDHAGSSGSADFTIAKANAAISVSGYAVTYDGTSHTAAGSATGVGGAALSGLNLSGTTHTNAGGYTDTWTFTDATGNYNNASGTVADTINKANASLSIGGYSVTYDGNAHTATGTAKAVDGTTVLAGLNLSGTTHTNAGSFTDTWTFTDVTGNYNNASGTVADTIAKANASAAIVVTGYSVTFDGVQHIATGTATGVHGEDLSGELNLLGTRHTAAGSYTDVWSFAGDVNYNAASSTVADTITPAGSAVTVTWANAPGVIYDGNQHGATAGWASTSTDGGAGALSVHYVGINGTVYDAAVAPTNAGQYRATASFAGDANHTGSTGFADFTIAKANAVLTVNPYSVTYNGVSHTATGSATGIGGAVLSGLDLSATSHANAGSYTDGWTFTDVTGNYTNASGSVVDAIAKAGSTTTVLVGDTTYDGTQHGGTASWASTGADDETDVLTVTYVGINGTVYNSTTAPTNAGQYQASASFAGDLNHTGSSDTKRFTIAKANATISVQGYSGVYDGFAHGATGSATGAQGEDLSAQLNLGASFTNVPGGTASWTFTDTTGNYRDASGSVAIDISKADATIRVTSYSVTYDGAAHTATGTATGVRGEDLSGLLDLSGTTHTHAGSYSDGWGFTGDGNYNSASGTVADAIARRAATWTTADAGKTYGDADPSPLTTGRGTNFVAGDGVTASYTRVAGETAGTYHITATLSATGDLTDYSITNPGATFTIGKAGSAVSVTWADGASTTYDGQPHGASASWASTGLDNEGNTLSVTYQQFVGSSWVSIGAAPIGAGQYRATASFAGDANHTASSGYADFTIDQAGSATTVLVGNATYDGAPHGGTASWASTGSDGEGAALTVTYVGINGTSYAASTTAPTNAGQYSAAATFAGDANHTGSSDTQTFTIFKRDATWTTNDNGKAFGDLDPSPLTTGGGSNFVGADGVTASYSRAPGEAVGTYHITATLSATVSGALANYNIVNEGATFGIGQAGSAVTVTWDDGSGVTYDGAAHAATASWASTGADGQGGSLAVHYVGINGTTYDSANAPVNAGDYRATASFAGDAGHTGSSGYADFTILKRDVTWTTTDAGKTYGDFDPTPLTSGSGTNFVAADGVTASYSRASGEAAGTYHITATLSATVSGALDNYNVTNAGATFTIGQAGSTTTVVVADATYDGAAHGASAGWVSTGLHAEGAALTVTYVGINGTVYNSTTAPTNAGQYQASASFAGDLNHTGSSDTKQFTIAKRDATWTTADAGKTYGDTDPAPLTTGSGTNFVAADGVTASYSRVAGESAGTYHITATLSAAGDLANYTITNAGATFTVGKAGSTTTVVVADATYDGTPHGGTAGWVSTGLDGEGAALTVTYVGINGTLYAASTTAPTNAGQYQASASFAGDDNHTGSSDAQTFTIAKADAVIAVTPVSTTYDGSAHGATGTATGAQGEDLSALLDLSATTHTHAGSYTDSWSFAGNANYNSASNTITDAIARRDATWTTNDAGKIYGDADPAPVTTGAGTNFVAADGVTASYSRVAGEVPGTYAITATLSATGDLADYNITNAGATFTITDAVPTFSITDQSVVEGNSGTRTMTFTVTLDHVAYRTIHIDFATQDNTATAGSDYQTAGGTLDFATDVTSQQFTVTVYGDQVVEGNETFKVVLGSATTANTSATATGTIIDDDTAGIVVGPTSLVINTTGQTVSFTVRLTSQPTNPVTIALGNSAPEQGTLSTTLLVFTAADWDVPQVVSIHQSTGATSGLTYHIVPTAAASLDAFYAGMSAASVAVTDLRGGGNATVVSSLIPPPATGGSQTTQADRPLIAAVTQTDGRAVLLVQSGGKVLAGGDLQPAAAPAAVAPPPPAAPAPQPRPAVAQPEAPRPAPPAPAPAAPEVPAPPAPSKILENQTLWTALDEMKNQVENKPDVQLQIAGTVTVGVAVSVGYVLLVSRAALWLLLALTAKPLWRQFDPLDVLYAWEQDKERRKAAGADEEESLQSIVDKH